jgi:hypothetical protein
MIPNQSCNCAKIDSSNQLILIFRKSWTSGSNCRSWRSTRDSSIVQRYSFDWKQRFRISDWSKRHSLNSDETEYIGEISRRIGIDRLVDDSIIFRLQRGALRPALRSNLMVCPTKISSHLFRTIQSPIVTLALTTIGYTPNKHCCTHLSDSKKVSHDMIQKNSTFNGFPTKNLSRGIFLHDPPSKHCCTHPSDSKKDLVQRSLKFLFRHTFFRHDLLRHVGKVAYLRWKLVWKIIPKCVADRWICQDNNKITKSWYFPYWFES